MRISEAAAASGCHLETIRYYERVGLIPPPARRGNGYRAYEPEDVERLRFISRGRDLGFSLDEIRGLLALDRAPGLSCSEVDAIARAHLDLIRGRVAELSRMATELERIVQQCAGDARDGCAILQALRHLPPAGSRRPAPGV